MTAATTKLPALDSLVPQATVRRAKRKWGLRRRILLIFTLGALMLSLFLALVTYGFTRSSLVQQRDTAARAAARSNASIAFDALRVNPSNAQPALTRLDNLGVERPLLWYGEQWAPLRPGFDQNALAEAQDLIDRVIEDGVPARKIIIVGSEPNIAVGYPLPTGNNAYFEFFSLDGVNDTLRSVRLSLVLGTMITTALGVLAGSFAARRAVRPVGVAAQAAKAIAGGRLDTRLEPTEDPDLSVLANSFNDMATALQTRIERDARFASDVSHELRSPLMTLSASVEVMDARRDDMPERAQAALDLLKSDVIRFQGLVEDLLEISRFDAGAVRLHREELLAAEFVRQAIGVSSLPNTPVDVSPRAEMLLINGDRRRLASGGQSHRQRSAARRRSARSGHPRGRGARRRDQRRAHLGGGPRQRCAGTGTFADLRAFRPWRGRRTTPHQRWGRARPGTRRRTRPDARWPSLGRGSTRR